MGYQIYKTELFAEIFNTLEKDEKVWIGKMVEQLKHNPYAGKPLKFPWFREKKFRGARLYFIIYENLGKILLVGFGGKKEQQMIIDSILRNLDAYKRLAERL
ncbi:MAG: hypothetical protein HY544_04550 [Candidatus Diapherotrites archaeon]|uniref:Type II toxin-antitoxin system RelE/ParE family toxin n=1 Tax=Candidatus Iainarchaeum sp. TaxID=3101447 RepID=A0A8T3YM36_9ARCH|nr:hypothetical protein [Candidatus Diapherotrites archaeon]